MQIFCTRCHYLISLVVKDDGRHIFCAQGFHQLQDYCNSLRQDICQGWYQLFTMRVAWSTWNHHLQMGIFFLFLCLNPDMSGNTKLVEEKQLLKVFCFHFLSFRNRKAFESLNFSWKNAVKIDIFLPQLCSTEKKISWKMFLFHRKKGEGVWVMLSICFRCTVCTSIAIFYEAEDKTKREKIPHLHLLHKIVFFVFLFYRAKREKYLTFTWCTESIKKGKEYVFRFAWLFPSTLFRTTFEKKSTCL